MDAKPMPGTIDDQEHRATQLTIVLDGGDPWIASQFKDSLLDWVHGAANPLSREVGSPSSVNVDEQTADDRGAPRSRVRLTLSWAAAPSVAEAAAGDQLMSDWRASSVFFPDTDRRPPVFRTPEFLPTDPIRGENSRGRFARRMERAAGKAVAYAQSSRRAAAAVRRLVVESASVARFATREVRRHSVLVRVPRRTAIAFGVAVVVLSVGVATMLLPRSYVNRQGSIQHARVTHPVSVPVVAQQRETANPPAPIATAPAPQVNAREVQGTTALQEHAAAPVTATASAAKAANRPRAAAYKGFVGSLTVRSDPDGAEVTINGIPRGRTPLNVGDLPAGNCVVRLDMPGYAPWSWSVGVVANRRTPLSVKLRPGAPAGGLF